MPCPLAAASTLGCWARVRLRLRERADVYDAAGKNVGVATLPFPVKPGDAFAFERGPLWRVAAVSHEQRADGLLDCAVEAAPVRCSPSS
jgi:hypothetical protein